jgi:hypothetical protein
METASAGHQGRRRRTGQAAAAPRGQTASNLGQRGRYHEPAGDVKRVSVAGDSMLEFRYGGCRACAPHSLKVLAQDGVQSVRGID